MTKATMIVLSVASAALFAAPTSASAQVPGAANFVNVSVGAQPQQRTVDANATTTIYDEDAVFSAQTEIGNGPFFDFTMGHQVRPHFYIGAGFTYFTSKGNANGTAAIPDPIFVGQPTTIPVSISDLNHSEETINLQATWIRPMGTKFDVAISAGPSIVHMSQEFLSGTLSDTGDLVLQPDAQGGWGFGLNVGADLTYLFNSRYGVGVLLRYTWAQVGLDAADVTAGGFQGGVGLRMRF